MFRQYFKQAIQILKENRLTSVISILGTALSIAMIPVSYTHLDVYKRQPFCRAVYQR